MREPQVEERIRQYLSDMGYEVFPRHKRTGPDIFAKKKGRILLIEVKRDRLGHVSSPATINVDVMTLLGQLLFRKGEGQANDYAIAIRPVHQRLIEKTLPALKEISAKVFLVGDFEVEELQ